MLGHNASNKKPGLNKICISQIIQLELASQILSGLYQDFFRKQDKNKYSE